MTKALRIMNKAALRQKGWWLFATVIGLQILFVVTSYLIKSD